MKLGQLIRRYCFDHAMTYQQFADASHISKGYVSMLVNNRNPKTGKPLKPTVETYMDIASAMGMTLDELFRTIDDSPVTLTTQPEEQIADDELWEIREELRRNPEYRSMLKLTKGATKKEMEQIKQMIRVIRGSNDYDETDTP